LSSKKKKQPNPRSDLKLIRKGDCRQIFGPARIVQLYETLKKVKPDDFATLDAAFDRWLSHQRLTKRQFNSEGRHPVEGKQILLMAFKAGMFRFYGSIFEIGGVETFVIVNVDQKKQNKADPNVLATSAKRVRRYIV